MNNQKQFLLEMADLMDKYKVDILYVDPKRNLTVDFLDPVFDTITLSVITESDGLREKANEL